MNHHVLLKEMKRISKYQIVSFPNFANWRNRLDLILRGRMPKPILFGYTWYNTGHIHHLSIRDFEGTIYQMGLKVSSKTYFYFRKLSSSTFHLFPNLMATEALYLLED